MANAWEEEASVTLKYFKIYSYVSTLITLGYIHHSCQSLEMIFLPCYYLQQASPPEIEDLPASVVPCLYLKTIAFFWLYIVRFPSLTHWLVILSLPVCREMAHNEDNSTNMWLSVNFLFHSFLAVFHQSSGTWIFWSKLPALILAYQLKGKWDFHSWIHRPV